MINMRSLYTVNNRQEMTRLNIGIFIANSDPNAKNAGNCVFSFQCEKFVRSASQVKILNLKRISGWKRFCRSGQTIPVQFIRIISPSSSDKPSMLNGTNSASKLSFWKLSKDPEISLNTLTPPPATEVSKCSSERASESIWTWSPAFSPSGSLSLMPRWCTSRYSPSSSHLESQLAKRYISLTMREGWSHQILRSTAYDHPYNADLPRATPWKNPRPAGTPRHNCLLRASFRNSLSSYRTWHSHSRFLPRCSKRMSLTAKSSRPRFRHSRSRCCQGFQFQFLGSCSWPQLQYSPPPSIRIFWNLSMRIRL